MSHGLNDNVRVIILCKAPVPGRAKTRLMPAYTAGQAADLHMAMARTVMRRAQTLFADVLIAADDVHHPFFASLGLPVVAQGEGDLGHRLARLNALAFSESESPVLFLGTDSPHMQVTRLQQAVALIRKHDVVLGPVEDGGYDLIACRGFHSEVFARIRWGSRHVLADTLIQIEQAGLSRALLTMSFDVDEAADVDRAIACGWRSAI